MNSELNVPIARAIFCFALLVLGCTGSRNLSASGEKATPAVCFGIDFDPFPIEIVEGSEVSAEIGLLVKLIESNSPADRSDLRIGDVIVSMSGQRVLDRESYWRVLDSLNVSEEFDVGVVSGSISKTIVGTVGQLYGHGDCGVR